MTGQRLALRPHPAGRFTQRNGVVLPDNVDLSSEPLYDLNLGEFSCVISAPSTILFDFAVAGVPAAVWVGADKDVDARNFSGLSQVGSVDDWWRFHWAATWDRDALVASQGEFLLDQQIPDNVQERYLQLLALATA